MLRRKKTHFASEFSPEKKKFSLRRSLATAADAALE